MKTHFQLVGEEPYLMRKIFCIFVKVVLFIIGKETYRARQDSNLQSSDPKSDALSVTPRAHLDFEQLSYQHSNSLSLMGKVEILTTNPLKDDFN
ncbi:hypothetical protein T05_7857 [Trichinella murrelli]|uniref:Uncharacterized protein n=1 Tax=Trichinella murrelli TaxID=144512 RepID=A0A0V0TUW5_9BILA|nr:hypothetical protein T05_7857 [Trichinella murrelli]